MLMLPGFLSWFLNVRQLDLGLLMQKDVVGRAAAAGDAHQQQQCCAVELSGGVEEVKSVKLFGVLLKNTARKRVGCEEAATSEWPVKMIRIGESWVDVPSSGPGRFGGKN
ncbi:unnamed protein product [Urochloa humidicola]